MQETYFSEERIDEEVQKTTENLVSHQNRKVEVRNSHGTVVCSGVWPVSGSSKAEADHVDREREGE